MAVVAPNFQEYLEHNLTVAAPHNTGEFSGWLANQLFFNAAIRDCRNILNRMWNRLFQTKFPMQQFSEVVVGNCYGNDEEGFGQIAESILRIAIETCFDKGVDNVYKFKPWLHKILRESPFSQTHDPDDEKVKRMFLDGLLFATVQYQVRNAKSAIIGEKAQYQGKQVAIYDAGTEFHKMRQNEIRSMLKKRLGIRDQILGIAEVDGLTIAEIVDDEETCVSLLEGIVREYEEYYQKIIIGKFLQDFATIPDEAQLGRFRRGSVRVKLASFDASQKKEVGVEKILARVFNVAIGNFKALESKYLKYLSHDFCQRFAFRAFLCDQLFRNVAIDKAPDFHALLKGSLRKVDSGSRNAHFKQKSQSVIVVRPIQEDESEQKRRRATVGTTGLYKQDQMLRRVMTTLPGAQALEATLAPLGLGEEDEDDDDQLTLELEALTPQAVIQPSGSTSTTTSRDSSSEDLDGEEEQQRRSFTPGAKNKE